jgi:hypothetical protein
MLFAYTIPVMRDVILLLPQAIPHLILPVCSFRTRFRVFFPSLALTARETPNAHRILLPERAGRLKNIAGWSFAAE